MPFLGFLFFFLCENVIFNPDNKNKIFSAENVRESLKAYATMRMLKTLTNNVKNKEMPEEKARAKAKAKTIITERLLALREREAPRNFQMVPH